MTDRKNITLGDLRELLKDKLKDVPDDVELRILYDGGCYEEVVSVSLDTSHLYFVGVGG